MFKLAAKRVRDGGGIQNVDEAAVGDVLGGEAFADWTVDLRVASWAIEQYGIYSGKLGRLLDRVYGGYACSHFT